MFVPPPSAANDGMDSSWWYGIIVPTVNRPLEDQDQEESR
jgi:hypothetical protein